VLYFWYTTGKYFICLPIEGVPWLDEKKERSRKASRKWYEENRELTKQRAIERRKRLTEQWVGYKKTKSCSACGASHPAVLDFHHVVREDKKSVSILVKNGKIAEAIAEAEAKCVVLCSNCHRKHHWEERLIRGDLDY
jgi:hypothetical protein